MPRFTWTATVRDHRSGDITAASGTTEASSKQQAATQARAAVRQLPGRKTATDVRIY